MATLSGSSLIGEAVGMPVLTGKLVVNGNPLEGDTGSKTDGSGLEVVTGERVCVGEEHTARESVTRINIIVTNLIIAIWICQIE